jgi:hypothetical protein
VLQVVQILEQPPARHVWAQRFLRLADDRGWVLENHPKVSLTDVVVPAYDDPLRYLVVHKMGIRRISS